MTGLIKVRDLYKSYNTRTVLHGISFEVQKGECFCLLGPNGAGKTTTLKILTGFLDPDQGEALVLGINIKNDADQLKGKINIIPQQPALDPLLTTEENLWFFGMLQKIKRVVLKRRIRELLDLFELEPVKNQLAMHLSGGEFQRLTVARAFIKPTEIIFMDEPTSGIDILLKNKLWDIFKAVKDHGMTIFLNTHDLNEAEVLSDRIGFIFNGRIVMIDKPQRLKRMNKNIKFRIEFDKPFTTDALLLPFKCRKFTVLKKSDTFIEIRTPEVNREILTFLNLITVNCQIKTLEIKQPTLNDVFKRLGVNNAGNNLA